VGILIMLYQLQSMLRQMRLEVMNFTVLIVSQLHCCINYWWYFES